MARTKTTAHRALNAALARLRAQLAQTQREAARFSVAREATRHVLDRLTLRRTRTRRVPQQVAAAQDKAVYDLSGLFQ